MKRIGCLLMAIVLLLGLAGCAGKKPSNEPAPEPAYVPLEPLTYTALPTELKAEKVGSVTRQVGLADGGLYYREGDKYGIMTPDGKLDTGAIYTYCQPKGDYFAVSKFSSSDTSDVTLANTTGLVDAAGGVIVPLQYASVELLGDHFVRVAELTGRTENAEEKLTQFVEGDKTVMCTGNWYIYDLETRKAVPGATGTKPYISFDCGGYVKYVLDDKTVVNATPDGKALPEEPIHIKNGHYALPSENAVYDLDGNRLFTYDPAGYIPVDSEGVSGYIVGKKTVDGKDAFVLLDLTGKVVSDEFDTAPQMVGELVHADNKLMSLDGKVVADSCNLVFWESLYGQSWIVQSVSNRKVIDKTGAVLYECKSDDLTLGNTTMLLNKNVDGKKVFYSAKDKDFTLTGVAVAPFLVKVPNGESYYDVINVLTGEIVLSGYTDYRAKIVHGVLYVYASISENAQDVFTVR